MRHFFFGRVSDVRSCFMLESGVYVGDVGLVWMTVV